MLAHTHNNGVRRRERMCVCTLCCQLPWQTCRAGLSTLICCQLVWREVRLTYLTHTRWRSARAWPARRRFRLFHCAFWKIICIKTDWQVDNNKEWVRINSDYWGSINDIFERVQWAAAAAAAAPAGRSLGKHIFGSTPSSVRGRKEDSTGLSRPGSKLVSGQIGARLPLKGKLLITQLADV